MALQDMNGLGNGSGVIFDAASDTSEPAEAVSSGGAKASGRKLTKNEKRRQRQKQQKSEPTAKTLAKTPAKTPTVAAAGVTEAPPSQPPQTEVAASADAVAASEIAPPEDSAAATTPPSETATAADNAAAEAAAAPGAAAARSSAAKEGEAVAAAATVAPDVEVEYVSAELLDLADLPEASMLEFRKIFEHFAGAEDLTGRAAAAGDAAAAATASGDGGGGGGGEEEDGEGGGGDNEDGEKAGGGLSRKQRKLRSRLTVAELKQLVARPDVVEAHDVTAADPRMLVLLKACRNTVAVPRHWCNKRKYLQGKRGIDKKPFELPDFIAATGISKVRQSQDEAEGAKKARQKARERVQPKTGKMDIDYHILHDAFFKWQTKPKLTHAGDLYYEGREFEVRGREKKPGRLSAELREALGMHDASAPPPWLINMQRYGPPPSYPALKIPGLNGPIPPGASFGYHVGGWGKPPVDEAGNPLYGDVFGTDAAAGPSAEQEAAARQHWGDLAESEDEEEEEEAAAEDAGGDETPMGDGAMTAGGAASVATTVGLETPGGGGGIMDLRKRAGLETPETPARELYKVIEQREAPVGAGLFGADKRYVVAPGGGAGPVAAAAAAAVAAGGGGGGGGDVAVALNPDELEDQLGDSEALRERYEASLAAAAPEREDVSDIVAEETRKRKRKMDKAKESKTKRTLKDFQF
ncbi:unnamed protein product [Phaeothamnion confervicola]